MAHREVRRSWLFRSTCVTPLAVAVLAIGAAPDAPVSAISPAIAQSVAAQLPATPSNGVMGFVVWNFAPAVIQGKDACPEGPVVKLREQLLASFPPAERERLQLKENEREFLQRMRDFTSNAEGDNLCAQYAKFPNQPTVHTVQSPLAWGVNLDDDEGKGAGNPDGCAHNNFASPDGLKGIDNQAYRALGCKLEWRGVDGTQGDMVRAMQGFLASGEFTQVLLLRGVDSLVNDDSVDVIYGNTPDRPVVNSTGKFVWNTSFTISEKAPRERNVLHGRIVNGVLTTDSKDIKLTQTWGQSAQRDLRGIRNRWTLNKSRLRLTFQPDGSLKGYVGGYQPLDELVTSPSLGGMGTIINAGIDCAGEYNTMKKLADGNRDPKTGQCTTISTGLELSAVPAFVNDVPGMEKQRVASK